MPPHRAIMLVFALQPLALGAWLARIPEMQTALGLGPATLGLALLGLPAGTLVTLPFGGAIADALGARRLILTGFVLFLGATLLPPLATGPWLLCAALFAVGGIMALLELGLNVEAARIEIEAGRLIMATCHGFWSLGIALGSGIGVALAALGLTPALAALLASGLLITPSLYAAHLLPVLAPEPQAKEPSPLLTLPSRPVLAICLFVFGITMTEGAMADWAGIFLRDVTHVASDHTGIGYGIFASLVAGGRFIGDALKARLGAVALARLCGGLAIAGLAALGLATGATMALAALGLIGFGVSVGFPLAVSAVVSVDPARSSANTATLSMISLGSFLIGPTLIGLTAEMTGIRLALMLLVPVLAVSLGFSGALRARG